jgi:hypothetical protein
MGLGGASFPWHPWAGRCPSATARTVLVRLVITVLIKVDLAG